MTCNQYKSVIIPRVLLPRHRVCILFPFQFLRHQQQQPCSSHGGLGGHYILMAFSLWSGKNSKLRKENNRFFYADPWGRWYNLTGEKTAIWIISGLNSWFLAYPNKNISWWTQSQLHWMPVSCVTTNLIRWQSRSSTSTTTPRTGLVVWWAGENPSDTTKWWDFSWQISWNPICWSLIQPHDLIFSGMRSQVKSFQDGAVEWNHPLSKHWRYPKFQRRLVQPNDRTTRPHRFSPTGGHPQKCRTSVKHEFHSNRLLTTLA